MAETLGLLFPRTGGRLSQAPPIKGVCQRQDGGANSACVSLLNTSQCLSGMVIILRRFQIGPNDPRPSCQDEGQTRSVLESPVVYTDDTVVRLGSYDVPIR